MKIKKDPLNNPNLGVTNDPLNNPGQGATIVPLNDPNLGVTNDLLNNPGQGASQTLTKNTDPIQSSSQETLTVEDKVRMS